MNVPLLKQAARTRPTGLASDLTPGAYVTDEKRLFRCLSRDPMAGADEMVLLEECVTLEVFMCAAEELAAMEIRTGEGRPLAQGRDISLATSVRIRSRTASRVPPAPSAHIIFTVATSGSIGRISAPAASSAAVDS